HYKQEPLTVSQNKCFLLLIFFLFFFFTFVVVGYCKIGSHVPQAGLKLTEICLLSPRMKACTTMPLTVVNFDCQLDGTWNHLGDAALLYL
ncbi:hypothetical protein ACQP3L_29415, partial [Escherichia coli]